MNKKILLIAMLSSVSLSVYPTMVKVKNNTDQDVVVSVKALVGWSNRKKVVPTQEVTYMGIASVRAISFKFLINGKYSRRNFIMDKKFTGFGVLRISLDGWKKVSGTWKKAGNKVESFIWPQP